MSQWCRLWDDMPNDPKWRVVARRSSRPVSEVLAVFVHMMTNAVSSRTRGSFEGWSDEDVAIAIDAETEHVQAIRTAMQGKTLEGEHLTGWERRQPLREDGSAERAKAWRDGRKAKPPEPANEEALIETLDQDAERNRTQPNARVEQSRVDTDSDATLSCATRHDYDAIEQELHDAAGGKLNPARYPALKDLSPIIGLLDAGFDLRSEILPVVRAKARPDVKTWSYFVDAVHESRSKRRLAAADRPNDHRPRAGPRTPDTIVDPMIRAGAKYFTADTP